MISKLSRATTAISLTLLIASTASAHYLWVTLDAKSGKHGSAKIYFEEGPRAGDGHYLDHFNKTSKTWIRTVLEPEPRLISTRDVKKEKLRWLEADLDKATPRSIDSYGKFGVYAYGKTNVLLHYYARNLDINTHGELHELGRAEQMQLDIEPHDHEKQVELTVLWRGKPAVDRIVYIRGPKKFRQNKKTDKNGRVRFEPKAAGQYTFRTSVEEDKAGEDGGKSYTLIRHNATLIMRLPLDK